MTTTVDVTGTQTPAHHEPPRRNRRTGQKLAKMNWFGGGLGWVWLFIVMIPIYWIVITSFKTQANYFITNTFAPPSEPTFDNYKTVIDNDIALYFFNSVLVTVGAIIPAVAISFMAAYAIVRDDPSDVKQEIERITNVRPGSPGYQNYQDWIGNTKLEQRVSLEDYSVSNRGLRAGLTGTPSQVADRVGAFADAGVDLLLLQCSPQLEEMERFADEVIGAAV